MVKRKRERSKTPEIPWELLLAEDAAASGRSRASGGDGDASGRRSVQSGISSATSGGGPSRPAPARPAGAPARPSSSSAASAQPGPNSEYAQKMERDQWRVLVGRLGALRGDPKTEALVKERHPELVGVAESCGAGGKSKTTLEKAREVAKPWFERGLKGSNKHGASERAKLCAQLSRVLEARARELASAPGAADPARLERLLAGGAPEEEGPLIAALLSRELEGSRYQGLWISRQGAGRYFLGDEHEGSGLPTVDADGARIYPRVRVVVKVVGGKLVIEGFFHEGEEDSINPARVPIGPFLTVYFEGVSLKEALNRWKDGPPAIKRASSGVAVTPLGVARPNGASSDKPENVRALERGLPSGWEIRESRSKKGVYYYANPAKGLSQTERPKS